MKEKLLLMCILLGVCLVSTAQVGINTDGSSPDESSILDIKSINKGILVPRMTSSERDGINNPATGLLVFCATDNEYYYNSGTPGAPQWKRLSGQWITIDTNIYYNSGNVGIGTTAPAQKLHVTGSIVAGTGSMTSASYRFGDGTENTGLSSPVLNALSVVTNGEQSGRIDASGRWMIGNGFPSESAQLEILSSTRGFLPPRLTKTQRDAISSPATGLMVFNTNTGEVNVFNGFFWTNLSGATADTWRCGQLYQDLRDGQFYPTVSIAHQCWFSRNINIGVMLTGSNSPQNNSTIEKYCYNDLSSNCNVYGGLYTWDEAMQYSTVVGSQGICPPGWHLPTYNDFDTLAILLGGLPVAGGHLKETGFTHWSAPNTGASDSVGFTALGAGWRNNFTSFFELMEKTILWSSDDGGAPYYALTYTMAYNSIILSNETLSKAMSHSCRCIKN